LTWKIPTRFCGVT
uniref:Antioxidin-TR n=1 Tax=Phyllomedusa trinitatis TaxID=332092 RepID=ATOX_PHYTB|nr:RecName: Full=Antioxidin-TR [Phyllomedusa trinitatis]